MIIAKWTQLSNDAAGGDVTAWAQNLHGDRMATCTIGPEGTAIQIWEPAQPGDDANDTAAAARDDQGRHWALRSAVQLPASSPAPISTLTWAHPESGLLLAAASEASGVVFLLEAPRPTLPLPTHQPPAAPASVPPAAHSLMKTLQEQPWRVAATLHTHAGSVRHLGFAPPQCGLLLAAGCGDGSVRIWEADRPLAPDAWHLQAKFRVSPPTPSSPGQGVGGGRDKGTTTGITCLAWRHFSPGVAPLLAVGTAASSADAASSQPALSGVGGAAQGSVEVWQYVAPLMAWQRVAKMLPLPDSPDVGACTAVCWSPSTGRPQDLLAVSHGQTVFLWGLSGETSSASCKLVARLSTGSTGTAPGTTVVWKLGFNMLGSCLAAASTSEEGGAALKSRVHLWKPNLVGQWILVNVAEGDPDVAAEEEHGAGGQAGDMPGIAMLGGGVTDVD